MASSTQMIKSAAAQNKIFRAMKADPKKTGVLTLLVVVLAVMWVRMGAGPKGGATPAIAGVQSPASLVLGGTGASYKSGEVQAALTAWRSAEIPVALERNLFAAKLEYFPKDGTSEAAKVTTPAPASDGFWEKIEKSMSDQADQKREKRVLTENLQGQLALVRLQSTMMGARPKAVINGELVGVGGIVATGSGNSRTEFRVLKIEARRVIVEREGIELEIPMK